MRADDASDGSEEEGEDDGTFGSGMVFAVFMNMSFQFLKITIFMNN